MKKIVSNLVLVISAVALFATPTKAADVVVDLNELNPPLPDLYWNGDDLSGGFSNSYTFFNNSYNVDWSSWSGFAYSRVNDTNTVGWDNQYAVISGTDVDGDGTYAVAYESWDDDIVVLPAPSSVQGFYINNTTYTALDMLNGSAYSKKFGGATGDEPDWFKITVTGKDDDGVELGGVDFMLADYTSTNSAQDYIVTDWTWLDLSAIGPNVSTLHFTLSSSDNGDWGMNTPAYFALDNLTFDMQPASLVADLDNLVPALPDLYWNGDDLSGGFMDHGFFFNNLYNVDWSSWSGFAYSRVNDTNTVGWDNQYAVISGTDVDGDGTYAVAYESWDDDVIVLPSPSSVQGFYINNTTYTALDMLNGSAYSKKFGGATGDEPDWFKITVTGKDDDGVELGGVDFMLADYTSTNSAQDYIVTDWTWLDLTSIGPNVSTLHFALSSTDNGDWGMNTPAYFAIDEISTTPTFSRPTENYDNPFDAGVPGFVGPAGDGVPTSSAPTNYVNPIFGAWATTVIDYSPADGVSLDFTNYAKALGPVTGDNFDIVSLGDLSQSQMSSNIQPGSITLGFGVTISDKAGPDFSIFENGLIDAGSGEVFAELAYVEVSSDGINFARFPSISMTTNVIDAYSALDARNIYNLAGKHSNSGVESWGTPFDLIHIASDPMVRSNIVDISNINYIRIIDIPGSGDYMDSNSNSIYDAWLTGGSGGFDLEAVGVINSPQFMRISVEAGMYGAIAPYGMPNGQVSVPEGGNFTFNIIPDANLHIADVIINGSSIGITNSYTFSNTTNDQSISALFGYELAVTTPHGVATPTGASYLLGDASVAVDQVNIIAGSTQYVCTGWVGTGSITNGYGADTGIFNITNDSTVSWLWQTNYLLTATATQGGTVSPESSWHTVGSDAVATATVDPFYSFIGWTGDTQGDTNNVAITVTMNSPATITANFYAELATNDTPVGWLEYYNLTNNLPDQEAMDDTDNDGMNAWQEYLAGTDPTDISSVFKIVDHGIVNGSNYVVWLGGTNGSTLPFSVYTSGNLMSTNWALADGHVERSASGTNSWWHSSSNSAHYYRIKIEADR